MILIFFGAMFFIIDFDTAMLLLLISGAYYFFQAILNIYNVCYMRSFIGLVERNLERVPRNRAFSNMIYVPNFRGVNEYFTISAQVAAALRRREISFDQINDNTVLNSLDLEIGVELGQVKVMVISSHFLSYFDDYKKGYTCSVIQIFFNLAVIGVIIMLFSIIG